MSRQLSDLEQVLQQLIAEHRKLLVHVDAQQHAMRTLDLAAIEQAASAQETSRLRIATLDAKRRTLAQFLARPNAPKNPAAGSNSVLGQKSSVLTLTTIATLHPQRRDTLLKLGRELKEVAAAIASRTKVAGKLANAVLGHLNTVVRLLAGAVEGTRPQTYTKQGVPRAAGRIGVMEAVG